MGRKKTGRRSQRGRRAQSQGGSDNAGDNATNIENRVHIAANNQALWLDAIEKLIKMARALPDGGMIVHFFEGSADSWISEGMRRLITNADEDTGTDGEELSSNVQKIEAALRSINSCRSSLVIKNLELATSGSESEGFVASRQYAHGE